ncbi:MAG: hypothetical protein EOP04_04310 [Proteobacteria bacterium]|nr:MAG: hypothetical protein EOP04_04310 [Pseudomonadota bacterium]
MGEWNAISAPKTTPAIFSQETVNFLLELVLMADRFQRILVHPEGFIKDWISIDWNSRESILEILPFVETAYLAIPETHSLILRDVDSSLKKDGYRIRDGKLRKLLP